MRCRGRHCESVCGKRGPGVTEMELDIPLRDRLERLYSRRTFGIKLGLDVERALLAALGDPQDSMACIHVAGTNGKGSVCAMLDAMLREMGIRTGVYTSPHLVRFNERICVDGQPIADAELESILDLTEAAAVRAADQVPQEATFFEFVTAAAFAYFKRRGVQIAVIETGLGGRLDATNVVTPLVSVITRIGIEHTAYLGDTLEAIAHEKAGIIKAGRPVVCGAMDDAALAVIRDTARDRDARCVCAGEAVTIQVLGGDAIGQKVAVETATAGYGRLVLPLAGAHQVENLAIAIAVMDTLGDLGIGGTDPDCIKRGIARTRWPGRCQVLNIDPLIVLDAAHNPSGAQSLAAAMRGMAAGRPLGLICGFCDDKDVLGFFNAFTSGVKRVWIVPLRDERSMAPAAVRAAIGNRPWTVRECTLDTAWVEAVEWAGDVNGAVCVCGSLYLVGEVLEKREMGQLVCEAD